MAERRPLEQVGRQPSTLALVFGNAQNKFQDAAKLRRVIIDLIDVEDRSAMGADVKGDACEGLLERNARDTKSGAGQHFHAARAEPDKFVSLFNPVNRHQRQATWSAQTPDNR